MAERTLRLVKGKMDFTSTQNLIVGQFGLVAATQVAADIPTERQRSVADCDKHNL